MMRRCFKITTLVMAVLFSSPATAVETAIDHLDPVHVSVGVESFGTFCLQTQGKKNRMRKAIKAHAAMQSQSDPNAKVLALHDKHAIQVSLNADNICSVLFLTTIDGKAAAQQAMDQMNSAGIISGSGKKMGRFRTDFSTTAGTVIVINHESLSIKGIEIVLTN